MHAAKLCWYRQHRCRYKRLRTGVQVSGYLAALESHPLCTAGCTTGWLPIYQSQSSAKHCQEPLQQSRDTGRALRLRLVEAFWVSHLLFGSVVWGQVFGVNMDLAAGKGRQKPYPLDRMYCQSLKWAMRASPDTWNSLMHLVSHTIPLAILYAKHSICYFGFLERATAVQRNLYDASGAPNGRKPCWAASFLENASATLKVNSKTATNAIHHWTLLKQHHNLTCHSTIHSVHERYRDLLAADLI